MTSAKHAVPDNRHEAAGALIRGESTLTLATAGQGGAWSAPVYYVVVASGFYFFSSPRSRHIQQAIETGQAAASIFRRADSWQGIRGIQMRGSVRQVRNPARAGKAIAAYLQRFPFTRDFFSPQTHPGLDDFRLRLHAKLYVFTPSRVYYLDNRYGFANRQPIDWQLATANAPEKKTIP